MVSLVSNNNCSVSSLHNHLYRLILIAGDVQIQVFLSLRTQFYIPYWVCKTETQDGWGATGYVFTLAWVVTPKTSFTSKISTIPPMVSSPI